MFDIFSLPDFKMPDGFLWGAGYAGHQVEGSNVHSQNWKKEIDWNYAEKSGLACNSYALWKTDVDIAEKSAYRPSEPRLNGAESSPRRGISTKRRRIITLLSFRS